MAACGTYAENAWRKGICSNCFGHKDQHRLRSNGSKNSSIISTSPEATSFNSNYNYNRHTTTARSSGNNTRPNSNTSSSYSYSQTEKKCSYANFRRDNSTIDTRSSITNTPNTTSPSTMMSQSGSALSHVNSYSSNYSSSTSSSCRSYNVNVNINSASSKNRENRAGILVKTKMMMPTTTTVGGVKVGVPNKGILKSRSKESSSSSSKKGIKQRGVFFPKEAIEVIGLGDEEYLTPSEDEEDPPTDPLDNASVSEVLEKNSLTTDEQEFYRLTKKNTNFNSIKTNLLGTTNIEIGPILGGKKGALGSKPLVSIGTFESRNEPLKIQKKIDEDTSFDEDHVNLDKFRKFVGDKGNNTKGSGGSSPSKEDSSKNPQKSISSSSSSSSLVKPKPPSPPASSKPPRKDNPNNDKKDAVSLNNKPSPISSSSPSSRYEESNKSKSFTVESNKTTTVYSSSSSSLRNSRNITTDTTSTTSGSGSSPVTKFTSGTQQKEKIHPKPKSILKGNNTIPIPSDDPPTTDLHDLPPILSPKVQEFKNKSSSLSGLIIMTEGNSIASKRTSFLRDIIKDPTGNSSNPHGVTLISTQPSFILEEKDSLEHSSYVTSNNSKPPPPVPSKLRANVDLKFGREVTNPPILVSVSPYRSVTLSKNGGGGSGTDSEFDDSLEDSGLDIKISSKGRSNNNNKTGGIRMNNSEDIESLSEESDENNEIKLGGGGSSSSGSDSGNENDYSIINEKNKVNNNNNGLYISVGEEEITTRIPNNNNQLKIPSKLSPDSVLEGEMLSSGGSSGSSESIPEECGGIKIQIEERRSSGSSITKRQAPPPPPISKSREEEEEEEEDEIYDDVMELRKSLEEQEDLDESIYDDCNTAKGSYTFHKDSPRKPSRHSSSEGGNANDDDDDAAIGGDAIARRSDGIQFIGIRKIDSELFLKEKSPTPERKFHMRLSRRSMSPPTDRERSSSQSPKGRRKGVKVNQFFSTIGKRAGAAFRDMNSQIHRKSPSPFHSTGTTGSPSSPAPVVDNNTQQTEKMKKSLSSYSSTDEVSYSSSSSTSRAHEIYATLTPSSLKFKGMLNKLSKIDITSLGGGEKGGNNKDKEGGVVLDESDYSNPTNNSSSPSKNKNKNISKSIKKFLGLKNNRENHEFSPTSPFSPNRTPQEDESSPLRKPPPPPPRIHSLDVANNKMGAAGNNTNNKGTVKPARPPPPIRPPALGRAAAPSFTSVFQQDPHDDLSSTSPPSKPRRKNSIRDHQPGDSLEISCSYNNHITTLNLETLKLIANQPVAKIASNFPVISSGGTAEEEGGVRFSNFDLSTGMRPESLIPSSTTTKGFAIYPASFEGIRCLLLIQGVGQDQYEEPWEFSCVQTDYKFEEEDVPYEYAPWLGTQQRSTKALISVLPFFKIWKVEEFLKSPETQREEKYLSLLQVLNFWDTTEEEYPSTDHCFYDFDDLLVLRQPHITTKDRVYVHPAPTTTTRRRRSSRRSSDFEVILKQLLLTEAYEDHEDDDISTSLISPKDRATLIRKLHGSQAQIKSQLQLFFELKLFSPTPTSGEFLRIRRTKSEQALQQWMDKERAVCMKEAVERSLMTGGGFGMSSTDPVAITPWKKAYLQFLLLRQGNSAKTMLELFTELFEI